MSKTPICVVTGVAVIITSVVAVRTVRAKVDEVLARIDEALCRFGDDDDEETFGKPEADHVRLAVMETYAEMDHPTHGSLPVNVQLQFAETEPMAITMVVELDAEIDGERRYDRQGWQFARDLLDTALSREDGSVVGDGDVSVQVVDETDVRIWLTSEDGLKLSIDFDSAEPFRRFMATTFSLVPADQDLPDVDGAITHLLGGDQ